MVKVWRDVSEMKPTQVPEKYWELDIIMKEYPNSNKIKETEKVSKTKNRDKPSR